MRLIAAVLALGVAAGQIVANELPDVGSLLEEADKRLRAGEWSDAYELLVEHERRFAGDIQFDYLLGLAALESGRPARAVFALERVLVQQSRHAAARMELARALFAMGDYDRARAEFETLLEMDPPDRARVTIRHYLAAIEERDLPPVATRFEGYVEVGIGYDTNVNNATAQDEVAIPALGGLTIPLAAEAVERSDSYMRAAMGGELSQQLGERWSIYGAADAVDRTHRDERAFDIQTLEGQVGFRYRGDRQSASLGFHYGQLYQDRERNRRTQGAAAQWRLRIGARNQLAVFGQHTGLRYDELSVNDIDRSIGGVTWRRVLGPRANTLGALTVLGGREDAKKGRVDGDKDLWGVRAGVQRILRGNLLGFLGAGYQQGRFKETNPLFQKRRRDETWDYNLGMIWQVTQRWSVRPRVTYFENNSNVAINDFDRTDVTVSVRREFR